MAASQAIPALRSRVVIALTGWALFGGTATTPSLASELRDHLFEPRPTTAVVESGDPSGDAHPKLPSRLLGSGRSTKHQAAESKPQASIPQPPAPSELEVAKPINDSLPTKHARVAPQPFSLQDLLKSTPQADAPASLPAAGAALGVWRSADAAIGQDSAPGEAASHDESKETVPDETVELLPQPEPAIEELQAFNPQKEDPILLTLAAEPRRPSIAIAASKLTVDVADIDSAYQEEREALATAILPSAAPTIAVHEPQALPIGDQDPILSALTSNPNPTPTTAPAPSLGPGPMDVATVYGEVSTVSQPAAREFRYTDPVLPKFTGPEVMRRMIVGTPSTSPRVAQATPPENSGRPLIAQPIRVSQLPEVMATPPAQTLPGQPNPQRGGEEGVHRLSRPLAEVGIDTAPGEKLIKQMQKTPADLRIKDLAQAEFGDWNAPTKSITEEPVRYPVGMGFSWAAPSVYHRPLYFEQHNLERYGHHVRLCKDRRMGLQSAISAAHFFGTLPALPYLVGAEGACRERQYTLGAYRPGSCNRHQWHVPPLSLRGVAMEGASVTGLAFFIP